MREAAESFARGPAGSLTTAGDGPSHAIVGSANFTEIVRGVFQSAYLGFYGHASYSGQGLVKEGVRLLLRHAFTELRLHRVEANVRYLKIGGKWRDHERWAMLAEQWRGSL